MVDPGIYIYREGAWRLAGFGATSPPPVVPPPLPAHQVAYGHHDGARGNDALDQLLADSIGVQRPVASFLRGYSGSDHPATLASSSVRDVVNRPGMGVMLNVKRPWPELANGAYDALIRNFWETWPSQVWGEVTINHEPENDGPTPATPSNSTYAAWAATNGQVHGQGVRRYISLAAPIIRRRGLDVKIGSCLMDFSWDTTRWQYWKWWEGIADVDLPQVSYGIDAYAKTDLVSGQPVGHDLLPRIRTTLLPMRAVGISTYSLYETAVDRRQRNNGDVLVGTDASSAAWYPKFAAGLEAIPEVRMVCHFHTPGGPASDQAQLRGPALAAWARISMNGRRP